MVGRLAETLVLTKRIERFQILHATLLLIGGVRRIRPEYCQQAIASFPLHSFYNDTFGLVLNLPQASLIDTVLENYSVDPLLVNLGFTASIVETLLISSYEDVNLLSFGAFSASFIDSIKEYTAQSDTILVSLGFGVDDTALIDNVVTTSPLDTLAISFGTFAAILEDV